MGAREAHGRERERPDYAAHSINTGSVAGVFYLDNAFCSIS